MMLGRLIEVYEASLVNRDTPRCFFPETFIFNESWLLRAVLQEWKNNPKASQFGFLPFPGNAAYYSEGQLRTPFGARSRGDEQAESHSHVDGIVGEFSVEGTKAGIELKPGFRYVTIFEAKMLSPLAKGTRNASDHDQVSRLAACLIHNVLQAPAATGYQAHLVVVYAQENRYVRPGLYDKGHIADQIAQRLQAYRQTGPSDATIAAFADGWREALDGISLWFVTWEEVLAEVGADRLNEFYERSRESNR